MEHQLKAIGRIESDYTGKFGIPRQSGIVKNEARIYFFPPYNNPDCFRGIGRYSHIWLIWLFSENTDAGWSPTVRPPVLGGRERMGVFATRSPYRPNGLGLSCVRLLAAETDPDRGLYLRIEGADLVDQTPVFDIKPYLLHDDCHPQARGDLRKLDRKLKVVCPPEMLEVMPAKKRQPMLDCLSLDPRPAYHQDPDRVYGMNYSDFNIRFVVANDTATVIEITPL